MDPNEALRRLRKMASDTGGEFGETFEGLDEWITRGGFLPEAWRSTVGAAPIAGCDVNGEPV